MKYMLLICTDPDGEAVSPETDNIEEWVDGWTTKGVRPEGDRFEDAANATTVRVRGGKTLVTEGPFAETREMIAGYDILECADLDEAIKVASEHPMARGGRIEIRPFFNWDTA